MLVVLRVSGPWAPSSSPLLATQANTGMLQLWDLTCQGGSLEAGLGQPVMGLSAIHSGFLCPLRDKGAGDTRLACESNDALQGFSGVSRGYSCFYRAICSPELPCNDAVKGL